MKFWLTTLDLIFVIDGSTPITNDSDETESDVGVSKSSSSTKHKTPKKIDYHCFHKILSAMSESLYDIFFEYKSTKELWMLWKMNMVVMMLELKDSIPPHSTYMSW